LCDRFHFFFQAEDGIRDRNVTGVQTCALPILSDPRRAGRSDQTQCCSAGSGCTTDIVVTWCLSSARACSPSTRCGFPSIRWLTTKPSALPLSCNGTALPGPRRRRDLRRPCGIHWVERDTAWDRSVRQRTVRELCRPHLLCQLQSWWKRLAAHERSMG